MQDRMPDQQIQLSDAIASTSPRFPDAEGRCPVAVMKVGRLRFLQDLLGDELDQFSPNTVRLAVDERLRAVFGAVRAALGLSAGLPVQPAPAHAVFAGVGNPGGFRRGRLPGGRTRSHGLGRGPCCLRRRRKPDGVGIEGALVALRVSGAHVRTGWRELARRFASMWQF